MFSRLKGSGCTMSLDVIDDVTVAQDERLESLMQRRLGNRIRGLRVQVLSHGLVLHGRTNTYHAKQLAQHAAMELANLPILANEIEVC